MTSESTEFKVRHQKKATSAVTWELELDSNKKAGALYSMKFGNKYVVVPREDRHFP
jgi:hypothetical protein